MPLYSWINFHHCDITIKLDSSCLTMVVSEYDVSLERSGFYVEKTTGKHNQ